MAQNRMRTQIVKGRTVAAWVLLLSLFLGELFFYTWCRVQCHQVGIAIGQENRRQHELKTYQDSLRIELARLKAPERVKRIARNQLGLRPPEPQQVVVVP